LEFTARTAPKLKANVVHERMNKTEYIRFALRTAAAFGATEVFGLLFAGSVVAVSFMGPHGDTSFFGAFCGAAIIGFLVTALPCLIFALICAAVARICGWVLSLSLAVAATGVIFFTVLRAWPQGSSYGLLLAFAVTSGVVGMATACSMQTIWNKKDAQQIGER
jgi:hypothetical protein